MSIANSVQFALKRIGTHFVLQNDPTAVFWGSVQPANVSGRELSSAVGIGVTQDYRIFAEYNATTARFLGREAICGIGKVFIVLQWKPFYMGNTPLYYKGTVRLLPKEECP